MTDEQDDVGDLKGFGWFVLLVAAGILGTMLCSCASVAAAAAEHPAGVVAGWLLAQVLSLQDMLALLFGF